MKTVSPSLELEVARGRAGGVARAAFVLFALAGVAAVARADSPLPGDPFSIPQGAYQSTFVEDLEHVTHMSFTGDYNKQLPGGASNLAARAVVAREFYRTHQDEYDFLVTFTSFEFDTGDAVAFAQRVRNDVEGIGLDPYDNSDLFGSDGKLRTFVEMAATSRYELNSYAPDYDFLLSVLAHEVLHNWGIAIRYRDAGGQLSDRLLGPDDAHWSFLADTDASVEYGHEWRDNGDGTFSAQDSRRFYSPLDLYLMGLLAPEEVPDFFLVNTSDFTRDTLPRKGVRATGTRETVSIDDIVAAEGPRVPDAASSPKDFNFAFILLTPPGEEPRPEVVVALNELRRQWAVRFSVLTGGRGRAHVGPQALPETPAGDLDPITGGPLRTNGVSIGDGLDWLRSQQDADGGFSDRDGTRARDTAEVLRALSELDPQFARRSDAIGFLQTQTTVNTDSLARAIYALDGAATPAQLTELAARQNRDGGFGLNPGDNSDPLDSALAARALNRIGGRAIAVNAARQYLLARQNPNGGWPAGERGESHPLATALVSQTLAELGGADAALDTALAFLIASQHADGGFGAGESSVHETALVLEALLALDSLDAIELGAARGFLDAQQSTEGSFAGSTYTTAVALNALQSLDFPNWVVEALDAEDTALSDGERTRVTVRVRNDGNGPLPATVVRLYDGAPGAGGTELGERVIPPLVPQQAATADIFFDSFDRLGLRRLYAVVDPAAAVPERSELDNTRTLDVSVAAAPAGSDLEITAADLATIPSNPFRLPTDLGIPANVRNLGATPVAAVAVELWRGAPEGAGSELLDTRTVAVGSRSNTLVTFSTTLTQPGTTEFHVRVDPAALVAEAREDNNRAFIAVTTSDSLDLEIDPSEVSFSPDPALVGSDVVFDVRVANRGTLPAPPASVRFRVLGDALNQTLQTSELSLEPGQSVLLQIPWRVDRVGAFTFTAEIDFENTIPELTESNNQASIAFSSQIQTGANLRVDHRDLEFAPNPALEAQPVTLSGAVTNAGTVPLSGVAYAFFDGNPTGGGAELARGTISSLAPGETRAVALPWPNVVGATDRVIYLAVDPESEVSEIDELDNLAFESLEVSALPDLTLSAGSIIPTPAFPREGESVSIQVEVANVGQQPAGPVVVRLYAGDPSAGGTLIGSASLSTLAAMTTGAVSFSHALATGATSQELHALVDPDDAVLEGDEANNRAARSIAVQTGNAFVTAPFISPDGNLIQDDTTFFFALDDERDVSIRIVDEQDEVVRTATADFATGGAADEGQFHWDGRTDQGRVAPDGTYRLQAVTSLGEVLAESQVVVDTNRSSVLDAIGTRYGVKTNIDDRIGGFRHVRRFVSPDDEFMYFAVHNDFSGFTLEPGIYRSSLEGTGVVPVVLMSQLGAPSEFSSIDISALSPDGSTLILAGFRPGGSESSFAIATDGTSLRPLAAVDAYRAPLGYLGSRDFALLDDDRLLLVRSQAGSAPQGDTFVLFGDAGLGGGTEVAFLPADPGSPPIRRMRLRGTRVIVERAPSFDGHSSASLVDLSSGAVTALGGGAAWFPDGQRIAAVSLTSGQLRVLSPTGAVEQSVELGLSPHPLADQIGDVSGAVVSDDGRRVAFDFLRQTPLFQSSFDEGPAGGLAVVDLRTGAVSLHTLVSKKLISVSPESFHISDPRTPERAELDVLHFGARPHTLGARVPAELVRAGRVELQLRQLGHEEAEIDAVSLVSEDGRSWSPVRAREVGRDADLLAEVLSPDLRVADAHARTFEVSFEGVEASAPLWLSLTAREASPSRQQAQPFAFPSRDRSFSYKLRGAGALRVDGRATLDDRVAQSLFAVRAEPDTGHPTAQVAGFASDDGESLYAALDFGVDNSPSRAGDWASLSVRARGASEWRTFRLDADGPARAQVGFVSTDRVSHPHKYYEWKLPLAEIGVAPESDVELRFAAYGSAGIILSGNPTERIELMLEDGKPAISITDPYDSDDSYTTGLFGSDRMGFAPSKPELYYSSPFAALPVGRPIDEDERISTDEVRSVRGARVSLRGEIPVTPLAPELLATGVIRSPFGRALFFRARIDENGADSVFSFRSLLNLTADLRVLRSAGGGMRLEGSASDANFAEYRLEYREALDGAPWRPVMPPSALPVVDARFTTWVPPGPGGYFVRLTVRDTAGNQRATVRRASASESPAISDVYRDEPFVSPNGDGLRDSVTLHYRVREPVNLTLDIVNDSGQVVRTITRSQPTIGVDDSIVWDGRDALGFAVPDGDYQLVLNGVEFTVTIDRTAPRWTDQTFDLLQLEDPNGGPCELGNGDPRCTVLLNLAFAAELDELNLEGFSLESSLHGSGVWTADASAVVTKTDLSSGARRIVVLPRRGEERAALGRTADAQQLERLALYDYRLRARDTGGNEGVILLSTRKRDRVIVTHDGNHQAEDSGDPHTHVAADVPVVIFAGGLYPTREPRALRLTVAETVAEGATGAFFEYRDVDGDEWTTAPLSDFVFVSREFELTRSRASIGRAVSPSQPLAARSEHHFETLISPDLFPSSGPFDLRVRLRGLSGADYESNTFRVLFAEAIDLRINLDELSISADKSPVSLEFRTGFDIASMTLAIQSDGDPAFRRARVVQTVTRAGAPSLRSREGSFDFESQPFLACATYRVTATLTGVEGDTASISRDVSFSCMQLRFARPEPTSADTCGGAPTNVMQLRVGVVNENQRDFALTQLAIGRRLAGGGLDVLFNVVNPEAGTSDHPRFYVFPFDTSSRPDLTGETLVAQLTNSVGDVITQEQLVAIDHRPPDIAISSPAEGQTVCATQLLRSGGNGPSTQVAGVEIQATVLDRQQGLPTPPAPASTDWIRRELLTGDGVKRLDPPAPAPPSYLELPKDPAPSYRRADGNAPITLAPRRVTASGNLSASGTQWVLETPTSGEYTVRLDVTDLGTYRTCQERTFVVDAEVDGAAAGLAGDAYVSPNADSVLDSLPLRVSLDEPATLDVEVFSAHPASNAEIAAGRAVQSPGGAVTPDANPIASVAFGLPVLEGEHELEWDGRAQTGAVAPDGPYVIRLRARDGCRNLFEESVVARVDVTPPLVQLGFPTPSDPIPLVVEVSGAVADANLATYRLSYASAANPEAQSPISSGTRAPLGPVLGLWNTYGITGAIDLHLTASDRAGNTSALAVPLTLAERTDLVSIFEVLEPIFSPNADGRLEAAQIRFDALQNVLTTLEVLNPGGTVVRTLESAAPHAPGAVTRAWDGRNGAGSLVPDGRYSVRLTAQLASNPLFTQLETATTVLDATPPSVDVTDLGNGFLQNATPPRVAATDANFARYAIELAAAGTGAFATLEEGETPLASAPLVLTAASDFPDGAYTLRIDAFDAGETRTRVERALVIDRTAPRVTLAAPEAGAVLAGGNHPLDVAGEIDEENLTTYTVLLRDAAQVEHVLATLASAPSAGVLANASLAGIADGAYELIARATDGAGNSGSASVALRVDATPPAVALTQPANGGYAGVGTQIHGSISDANPREFEILFSPATVNDANAAESLMVASGARTGALFTWHTLPPDGAYRLYLRASDRADLSNTTSIAITVDGTPPAAPELQSATGTPAGEVSLAWSASASGDVAGYRVYRGGVALAPSLVATTALIDGPLDEGTYAYEVTAVDHAGNESARSAPRAVRIDVTPPTAVILSPQPGARVSGVVDVRGTAHSEDDFAAYRVAVGAGASPGSFTEIGTSNLAVQSGDLAQWETVSAADGTYTVRLEAEDQNGNVATTSAVVNVDNTPPAAPTGLAAVIASGGQNIQVTWNASAESDLAGYLLFRDGKLVNASGPVVGSLLPYALSGTSYIDLEPPDGQHTYVLMAIDQADNASDPSAPATITLDRRAPHVEFVRPNYLFGDTLDMAVESADTDIASVAYSYRREPYTGPYTPLGTATGAPFELSVDVSAFPLGSYQLRAIATDQTGHVDPEPPIANAYRSLDDFVPPEPVTNLQVFADGGDVTVTFTPSPSPDVLMYYIVRSRPPYEFQIWTPLDNSASRLATTFVDTDVEDGRYRYAVEAWDANSNSERVVASGVRVFTVELTAEQTPTTEAELPVQVRSPVAGALEASVVRTSGQTFLPQSELNANESLVLDPIALEAGDNTVFARVTDLAGNRSRMATLLYRRGARPSAPTGLTATAIDHTVELTWNPNPEPDVVGYELRQNGQAFAPESLAVLDVTSNVAQYGGAAEVVDGDRDTCIIFESYDPNASFVVDIELGSSQLLNELTLDFPFADETPRDFEMLAGNAGTYFQIGVFENHEAQDPELGSIVRLPLAQPVSADSIRIRVRSLAREDSGRATLCEVTGAVSSLIASTSASVPDVPDGSYAFTLRAVNALRLTSADSAPAGVAVGDVLPPAPVTLSGSVAGSLVSLSFSDSASADVASYEVRRGGEVIGTLADDDRGTYLFATSVPNGLHAFTVVAIDGVGLRSADSNTFSALVSAALLPAPQNVALAVQPEGAIQITWSPAPGSTPTSYIVLRSDDGGATYSRIATVTETTYLDTDVEIGAHYRYVVRAVDPLGNESVDSDHASGVALDTTPPAAPLITHPAPGGTVVSIAGSSLDIGGLAEPASLVELRSGGEVVSVTGASAQPRVTLPEFELEPSAGEVLVSGLGTPPLQNDWLVLGVETAAYGRYGLYDVRSGQSVGDLAAFPFGNLAIDEANGIVYQRPDADYARVVRLDLASGALDDVPISVPVSFIQELYFVPVRNALLLHMVARPPVGPFQDGLWLHDLETDETRLLSLDGGFAISISPTGNEAAFYSNAGVHSLMDLDSGATQTLAFGSEFDLDSQFSPDGTRLAYIGRLPDDSPTVWIRELASGALTSLAIAPTLYLDSLAWSPDGASLVYVRGLAESADVAMYSLDSGTERVLSHEAPFVSRVTWTHSGLILVERSDGSVARLEPAGTYLFEDAPLAAGDNFFETVAIDAGGNASEPSATLQVIADRSARSDLAVSLSVTPPLPVLGGPAEIRLTVENRGGAASQPTELSLVRIAPDGTGVAILDDQPLGPLEPDESLELRFPFAPSEAGEHVLLAVVDAGGVLDEASRTNNSVVRRVPVASDALPTLELETTAQSLGARSPLGIEVTLRNPGPASATRLSIRIEDLGGEPVAVLSDAAIELASGEERLAQAVFDTGGTFAGSYLVVAELVDAGGTPLGRESALLDILPDERVAIGVTADRGTYLDHERALVTAAVQRIQGNTVLSGAEVRLRVRNAAGTEVATQAVPLASLLPGAQIQVRFSWDTGSNAPGAYTLDVEVSRAGASLAASSTGATVLASGPSLAGTLSLAAPSVPRGQPISAHYRITNLGNAALATVQASVRLRSAETLAVLATQTFGHALALGASVEQDVSFATTGLPLGAYVVDFGADALATHFALDALPLLLVDGERPTVVFTSPAPGGFAKRRDSAAAIDARDDTGVARVEVSIDGSPFATLPRDVAGGFGVPYAGIAEGEHTLAVQAIDGSGNTSLPASVSFTLDDTPPLIEISGVLHAARYALPVTPVVTVSDAHLVEQSVQLDSVDFASGTPVVHDGEHVLTVTAVDAAGNTAAELRAFTIDRTPPNIAISGVFDGQTSATPLTPVIEVIDAHPDAQTITLNGLPFASGTEVTAAGDYLLAVSATDLLGNHSDRSLTFHITSLSNAPPIADAGPDQSVDEGTFVTLDGSASRDPENVVLVYTWRQIAGPAVSLSGASTAHPTFTAPLVTQNQTLTFELITGDDIQASLPDTVNVVSKQANNAPLADAGNDTTVKRGTLGELDGTQSHDPDGDSIASYQWTQTGGPPVTLQPSANVSQPRFTAPLAVGQVMLFRLIVSDGQEASTPSDGSDPALEDTVAVAVVDNSRPVANAGADQTVIEGLTVTLHGSGTDADLVDSLSYQWTKVSGPSITLSNASSATPTFTAPQVGASGEDVVFDLVVTDNDPVTPSSSLADRVVIHVQDTNAPPNCDNAVADPKKLWPPNHKFTTVEIDNVTDPDSCGPIGILILGVTQDEPLNGTGDGDTSPDARILSPPNKVLIRSERSGNGNGRVYRVQFMATDGVGFCYGSVPVSVPHSNNGTAIDSGQLYNSLGP